MSSIITITIISYNECYGGHVCYCHDLYDEADAGVGLELSEGQKEAILLAATSPVCVLTGGPGCGKTTITKYIVDLWQSQGKRMALCAPTGDSVLSNRWLVSS